MVVTELLKAEAKDIKEVLKEKDKEDNAFVERALYCSCIKEMKNINLHDIKLSDVKGMITVFLLRWGNVTRLGKSRWPEGLRKQIIEICDDLEKVRKKDIADNDLDKYRTEIKNCYTKIINCLTETTYKKDTQKNKKYQYTATSKVLHLIAPHFFPMWDNNIRKKTISEIKNEMKYNWEKYYEFMEITKKFMTNKSVDPQRPTTIKELSTNHKYGYTVSKLRIVDRFFWEKTHPGK